MTIDKNLIELYNALMYAWKEYEVIGQAEYNDDKIIIANSEEHILLIGYISKMTLVIRAELDNIFLIADSNFVSVIHNHIYKPLWEVYKNPITHDMTFKQCEHLVKTLNKILTAIYNYKSKIDLYELVSMLSIKSKGYRSFAEMDLGTIIAKKHIMTPPTDFGNGGFGPVGKASPNSLSCAFSDSKSPELSPHTEVLIENIKRTLENTEYGILKPGESEEEKNYKGNKDIIKNKDHFKGYFKKIGISVRGI